MVLSSARYKRDIHDMGDASDALMKLRPVTFRYKDDAQGIKQYGLVAEEVEKLYPELVIRDTSEKVQSIRYLMLTSMLLNELQKQARENQHQAGQVRRLNARIDEVEASARRRLNARSAAFEVRLSALERRTDASDRAARLSEASIDKEVS
jgi:hypothetical protein